MEREPSVAIILLNWNNYYYTKRCLDSLDQMWHRNFTYEVVVVDNGSWGANVRELKLDTRINHLIENEKNEGYVVASNQAIKYALSNGFDYILQLDNDAVVDEVCIEELVKIAEADRQVGQVGAKIFYYDEPNRLQWAGESLNFWTGDIIGLSNGIKRVIGRKEYDNGNRKYNKVREVDYIVSWCALSRREVWEKIGLLDEQLFFGWEDDDFSIRAKKAGYKRIYTPYAKVWHSYSSAFALDGLLQYHGPKTRFIFMRKHATLPQLIVFHLFFFGVHFWLATAYYLLWVRRPKVYLSFLKGVWEGVIGSKSTKIGGEDDPRGKAR